MVEEDFGATKESMKLWAQYLINHKLINCDIDKAVLEANRITEDHKSFLNLLYT